jgi:lipopolysaccharide exporter
LAIPINKRERPSLPHWLASPGRSLFHRALQASFWTFLLRSVTRAIGFARNVVLARLLAPEDFGLFGIALVVLSILERFTQTGLDAAVVQKREDVADYLDTAWTVQAFRGTLLAIGLVAAAPFIAGFFDEPGATGMLRLLGVSIGLAAFRNSGVLHYRRDLEFGKLFLMRSGGVFVELIVSVVLAVLLRNAWALMFGLVASRLTGLVLSFVVHPYRPSLRVDWSKLRELSRFGRWVFLNNMLLFLSNRGDNLVVGKMLGAPALGVYMLAYSISEVVTVELARIMNEIAFPAFSRLQGRVDALRRAQLLSLDIVVSVSLPVGAILCLLAEPLTLVILGSQWDEVAGVLPLLAVAGVVRALITTTSATFKGTGRPDLAFSIRLLSVIGTYLPIVPLTILFGLRGVAMAALAGLVVALPLALHHARRRVGVSWLDLGRSLMPGVVLSIAVVTPVVLASDWSRSSTWGLMAILLLCAASYVVVALLLSVTSLGGPVQVITMLRRRTSPSGLDSIEGDTNRQRTAVDVTA